MNGKSVAKTVGMFPVLIVGADMVAAGWLLGHGQIQGAVISATSAGILAVFMVIGQAYLGQAIVKIQSTKEDMEMKRKMSESWHD